MWGWLKVVGKLIVRYGPAVVGAVVEKKIKAQQDKPAPADDPNRVF